MTRDCKKKCTQTHLRYQQFPLNQNTQKLQRDQSVRVSYLQTFQRPKITYKILKQNRKTSIETCSTKNIERKWWNVVNATTTTVQEILVLITYKQHHTNNEIKLYIKFCCREWQGVNRNTKRVNGKSKDDSLQLFNGTKNMSKIKPKPQLFIKNKNQSTTNEKKQTRPVAKHFKNNWKK